MGAYRRVLPTSTVWVAEEGEKSLGFTAQCADMLDHLYVHPDTWDRGVRTQLLDTVRTQMDKLGLYAFQRNVRARRFYEARGFRLVTLRAGAANGEPEAYYEWHRPYPMMSGG